MIDLTEVHDGLSIHVRLGTTVRVRLQEFPESGFEWHASHVGEVRLAPVESARSAASGRHGGGRECCFMFVCDRSGRAEIVMQLRKPWLNESLRTWRVNVAIA